MRLDRYRAVLRLPGVRWLLPASLAGRLPIAMTALAITLVVTGAHQSYARAGLVTASYVIGGGIAGPFVGRTADRIGRRPVLATTAVLNAVLLVALALVPQHLPWVVRLVALLAGMAAPPLAASSRALWPAIVDGGMRESVYALEATAQELIFIVGPALVAGLVAVSGPRLALALTGVIGLAGIGAFVAHPLADRRAEVEHPHGGRVWRLPALRRLVVTGSLLVMSFNVVDLGVISYVSGRTASAAAGLVLAVWSLGSMTGGLLYGARPGLARVPLVAMICTGGVLLLACATSPDRYVLAALLFAQGATIAPALTRVYTQVSRSVPGDVATEAFAWLATGFMVGAAGGASLGGVVVSAAGPRATFVVAGCVAGLAALASVVTLPAPWLSRRRAGAPAR